MFTDSHCHLNFPELVSQLPAIRQAMAEAQGTRALCICTTLEEFDGVHALAMAHDNFWSTVGVHPDNEGIAEPSVQDLLDRAALPRVVAIGETGLDYYGMEDRKGGRSIADLEWQRDRFRNHIRGPGFVRNLWSSTRAAHRTTPSPSSAKRARTAPETVQAVSSTALPSRCRWRVRRWIWATTFPSRAS